MDLHPPSVPLPGTGTTMRSYVSRSLYLAEIPSPDEPRLFDNSRLVVLRYSEVISFGCLPYKIPEMVPPGLIPVFCQVAPQHPDHGRVFKHPQKPPWRMLWVRRVRRVKRHNQTKDQEVLCWPQRNHAWLYISASEEASVGPRESSYRCSSR